MTPDRILLAALHADPLDETAWLALADCLDDQGEPRRAELLRLHRAVRPLEDGPARWDHEARVRLLLAAGVAPCVPTLVNSADMSLTLIPPGVFWMGSSKPEASCEYEEPRHRVEVTRPFYLGTTAVTQRQYRRVTGSNPSHHAATGAGRECVRGLDTADFPVDSVTWGEAAAFCQRLSDRPSEQGRLYRLPTEAEWEYACRGWVASTVPFHHGTELPPTAANVLERGPDGGRATARCLGRTARVGGYAPNAFGLRDLHGNVWEWCADWFDRTAYYTSAPRDPRGPLTGSRRVLRGGSYNFQAWLARSACRVSYEPDHRAAHNGFRVVMTGESLHRT